MSGFETDEDEGALHSVKFIEDVPLMMIVEIEPLSTVLKGNRLMSFCTVDTLTRRPIKRLTSHLVCCG